MESNKEKDDHPNLKKTITRGNIHLQGVMFGWTWQLMFPNILIMIAVKMVSDGNLFRSLFVIHIFLFQFILFCSIFNSG